MRVATWRGGSRFTVDDAPEPAPGPGQVLVSVRAAGICGTDVHATQGLFPWSPPMVVQTAEQAVQCFFALANLQIAYGDMFEQPVRGIGQVAGAPGCGHARGEFSRA